MDDLNDVIPRLQTYKNIRKGKKKKKKHQKKN